MNRIPRPSKNGHAKLARPPAFDIPIVQTEMIGPGPICRLVDNVEANEEGYLVRRPGQHILCNSAGLELLKQEIERRNSGRP